MKWLRSIVLFDKGGVIHSNDWKAIHASFVRSIQSIDSPRGSGSLKLREIEFYRGPDGKKKSRRNGVVYLRKRFLEHIVVTERWTQESQVRLNERVKVDGKEQNRTPAKLTLYPSGEEHEEANGANFGDFDFLTTGPGGHKVAIEWETGNVSSSHRALNKLCICLERAIISAGVLIVPSRELYTHLTDRIGNIYELNPYLSFWQRVGDTVRKGLLVVAVVEHDELTTDPSFPYLNVGSDGNANKD